MKHLRNMIICAGLLLLMPLAVSAAGGHTQSDHAGMTSAGAMMIVGSQTDAGVKAMAHIKDVREAMADVGGEATHHFMVVFVDEATGEQIEGGVAALKVVGPDGGTSPAIPLLGMEGHFGADVTLNEEGQYVFSVATKLPDASKRQYRFEFMNE